MANECKHEGCHCQVPAGRRDGFCSDHCRDHSADAQQRDRDEACACGHPDCQPVRPVAGNPSVPAATTEADARREAPALSTGAGQVQKGP
jgi:hypothetical protein